MAEMEKALNRQLGKKQKALALNMAALTAGFDFAKTTFAPNERLAVERMNETAGKILIEGNAAAAIGCLMAGVTVVAWYPITPSSSLCESLIDYMRKYRIDKGMVLFLGSLRIAHRISRRSIRAHAATSCRRRFAVCEPRPRQCGRARDRS